MDGMAIIQITPVLQVLFWNLLTTDRCCRRRYSAAKTILLLALFSTALFSSAILLSRTFRLSIGSGQFTLSGFIYLLPLMLLYRVKFSHLFTIMCTCWTYTLGILALSVQIAGITASGNIFLLLAVESLLFLLTIFPFYRHIVPKYRFTIENLAAYGRLWYKYILLNNTFHFLGLTALSVLFLREEKSFERILLLLCLLASIYLSYFILYRVLLDSIRGKNLEHMTLQDELTGLGNRSRLWNDLHGFLRSDKVFSLLFMDLDCFKQINDRYSHRAGDEYLKQFARISSDLLKEYGTVYRFGGDEFIALCPDTVPPDIIAGLEKCKDWDPHTPCPFNGVSIGSLTCRPPHGEAESVLQQADIIMYRNKLNKKTGEI